jgi:hypothetical protein
MKPTIEKSKMNRQSKARSWNTKEGKESGASRYTNNKKNSAKSSVLQLGLAIP